MSPTVKIKISARADIAGALRRFGIDAETEALYTTGELTVTLPDGVAENDVAAALAVAEVEAERLALDALSPEAVDAIRKMTKYVDAWDQYASALAAEFGSFNPGDHIVDLSKYAPSGSTAPAPAVDGTKTLQKLMFNSDLWGAVVSEAKLYLSGATAIREKTADDPIRGSVGPKGYGSQHNNSNGMIDGCPILTRIFLQDYGTEWTLPNGGLDEDYEVTYYIEQGGEDGTLTSAGYIAAAVSLASTAITQIDDVLNRKTRTSPSWNRHQLQRNIQHIREADADALVNLLASIFIHDRYTTMPPKIDGPTGCIIWPADSDKNNFIATEWRNILHVFNLRWDQIYTKYYRAELAGDVTRPN
jgi:hypothetical protein